MGILFMRVLIVALSLALGYYVTASLNYEGWYLLLGPAGGFLFFLVIIFLEKSIRRAPLKVILSGFAGLVIGLITAKLLTSAFMLLPLTDTFPDLPMKILLSAVFAYFGVVVGIRKAHEIKLSNYRMLFKNEQEDEDIKILDTSVIIDGRIADICETGFLEGVIMIPQFILKELQHIADSSDPLKRNRGKRGLEILQKIQKNVDINVRIVDHDFPKIKEVDAKLVALGKKLNAKVVTNDYNLNKVAELQGVPVLNINQLANAVKPVVLPGEMMNVYILKEGKEYGQGVAYLDDGTMVVVDNARKYIGKNVEVCVTSVLQTTAGRMIFTKLKEEVDKEEQFSSQRMTS